MKPAAKQAPQEMKPALNPKQTPQEISKLPPQEIQPAQTEEIITPRNVEITISIEAIIGKSQNDEPPLVDPSIRYNFFGQEKIQTPAIHTTLSGGESSGTDGWEQTRIEDHSEPALCFKFSSHHEIKGAEGGRRAFALQLDSQPVLGFWMSDRAGGARATALGPLAPPKTMESSIKNHKQDAPTSPQEQGQKGKTKDKGKVGGEAPKAHAGPSSVTKFAQSQHGFQFQDDGYAGRHFLWWWPLDVSPLLAGETDVSLEYGSKATLPEPDAAVEGLPTGLVYLRIALHASEALLNQEETDELNPLTVTITKVKDLPGVMAPDQPPPTKLKHLQETALLNTTERRTFEPLSQFCMPPYLVFSLFQQADQPRIVFTPPLSNGGWGPDLKLQHTATFLTGTLDPQLLQELLATQPLMVEVHDRDPKPTQAEISKKINSWEKLLMGGEPRHSVEQDNKKRLSHATSKSRNGSISLSDLKIEAPAFTAPKDLFEADAVILEEHLKELATAGDHVTHGVATFRLEELLSTHKQLSKAFARSKPTNQENGGIADDALVLKFTGDVAQTKRRIQPRGAGEEWKLSAGEQLVRQPGKYLQAGTSLSVKISLQRPLLTLQESKAEWTGPSTAIPRPFARAIFIFTYQDTLELQRILCAIDQVNNRALPDIKGSLKSYKLSEDEVAQANGGVLDIICGFQIIDEDCRMIVIEGLGDHGMTDVVNAVPRLKANDHTNKILSNLDIRFKKRMYTDFSVDLKKIHLRDPLPLLVKNPEIYNRTKVSEVCFTAVQRLAQMRESSKLAEVQIHNLFPDVPMLLQVESKYGETITMKDIHGVPPAESKGRLTTAEEENDDEVDGRTSAYSFDTISTTKTRSRRKMPTDSANYLFDEHLKSRPNKDFLKEQKQALERAALSYEELKKQREEEDALLIAELGGGPVHCYGGQSMHCVEIQKNKLRQRLAKDYKGTYTYSKDYVRAQFSMADENALHKGTTNENKDEWITERGFIYPAPKKPSEYNVHPKKPDETRLDLLKERWQENGHIAQTIDQEPHVSDGRPDFHVTNIKGDHTFGGFKEPVFTREYNSLDLGNYSKLPRGRLILNRDNDFFTSVHLCGDGLQKTLDDAKRMEEEIWKSKVVVDNIDFKVGRLKVKDKPSQIDRAKEILDGPALKKSLQIVRNVKLPSGKKMEMLAPPISINNDPFEDPRDFTADLRKDNPDLFCGTDPSGNKLTFTKHIHQNTFKEKSLTSTSTRKHPPLSSFEMQGPKWANKSTNA